MFRFANPQALYLLMLVPLLLGYFLYGQYRKRVNLKRFGNPAILQQLMPDVSRYKGPTKFSLQLLALALLVIVIAQPQFGSKVETVKKEGVELVIALDISNSMLARDISPSRLEKAKQMVQRMIDGFSNDKIGLIVFAGDAYTQLPITGDYAAAKLFINSVSPSMISSQGTAIGSALSLAMRSFSPDAESDKAIIVITDGENHEGNAVQMAEQAAEKGITVNVVGIGTTQGVPIPIDERTNDFRKDKEGNVVISKLNETMAQEIAAAGKGIYVRADNTSGAQRALTAQIDKMKKSEVESKVFSQYNEQYQGVAWMVLALLLFDVFILDRKNALMKRFDFFS